MTTLDRAITLSHLVVAHELLLSDQWSHNIGNVTLYTHSWSRIYWAYIRLIHRLNFKHQNHFLFAFHGHSQNDLCSWSEESWFMPCYDACRWCMRVKCYKVNLGNCSMLTPAYLGQSSRFAKLFKTGYFNICLKYLLEITGEQYTKHYNTYEPHLLSLYLLDVDNNSLTF